ncbi:uncharacterized protein K460DRAFT_357754 [Cucurbitaria berberidis CBS 394.84]|uniref:Uncharacterized protein n=1 Tax=Cucurbitaria berberidis CBS 394.84 TaxID=1168544 RepID=A0A9P4GES8_9PLEO|nr:uncharacterized protein K460DRAFT_357754 [Cucurbitaria berberidis CBS 394.84]KAF1844124.1 hypothetical protein K460DRAFT_357754 [Cucurbitaria berberidis CBS 394.84]
MSYTYVASVMNPTSSNPTAIPAATSGSRSKLLSSNLKNFVSKPAITHPQKALTVQLWNADQKAKMSSSHGNGSGEEHVGPRQTATATTSELDEMNAKHVDTSGTRGVGQGGRNGQERGRQYGTESGDKLERDFTNG